MRHTSIRLETPCEFINVVPVNPLISKCQIKVCYVGEKPNRNRSIITKDVARQMANSLPGSPIVGYYNEGKEDFEEHNRVIDISNGKFEVKDTTRPYGFVDINAKVWFQKFLDDGVNEHEYLMTEGYIWTGQYPESQRIIDQGNNQSMELDENYLDATWTKDDNGKPQFFIINEAIISKLCILGEECEPCFEGSDITAPTIQFSFDDGFKEQMLSMMNELKVLLNKEGGAEKVFTRYAVEIGDALWSALYSYIEKTFPDNTNCYCSVYRIEGVFEESGQKFAVLQNRADMKYYRLNFALNEDSGFVPSETLIEVTKAYTPAEEPQFALEAVEEYEVEYAKKKAEEKDKDDKSNQSKTDDTTEEKCPECGKPLDECECEKKKKKEYNLEEVTEYAELKAEYEELQNKFSALESTHETLQSDYETLKAEHETLKSDMEPLVEFKKAAEKKEKEEMIAQFYMLSDEDKADVIANIDTYSVDDIEAKLAILCVRNKVSFDLDNNKDGKENIPTVYNLNSNPEDDASTPAWIKAAIAVSERKN